ncbi:hypothetical protein Gpo141_00014797, partial [Globisporangium polare]
QQRQRVVEFYLEHLACFDNWDLVDLTSYKILGAWMIQNHVDTIDQFSEQIPALLSTSQDAIDVESEQRQLASAIQHLLRLLSDDYEQRIKGECFADYDLVHKACGWVLRECGRGDRPKLLGFLERYAALLPRTTLQYATEHLDRKLAKSLSSQGMLNKSPKRRRVGATTGSAAAEES